MCHGDMVADMVVIILLVLRLYEEETCEASAFIKTTILA